MILDWIRSIFETVESYLCGFSFTLPSEHILPLMFTLLLVGYQQKRPTRSEQLVGIHLTSSAD
ncbi:hypothetical protein KNHN1_56800 (plasmid) [Pseudomonas guariconensis]|jgi:hypothetical protein|nr:hypothetical protein CW309_30025 [Pseudomonas hunanensis]